MKNYKVYYHLNNANAWMSCELKASDKYQAMAKVQKLFASRSDFGIIRVLQRTNGFWYKVNSRGIKVFYKCSNCGHCVSEPTVKCSHCGRVMSIYKEV